MDISRTPVVVIEGTNPGSGTTTVTAVLADLAAEQHHAHVLDLSNDEWLGTMLHLEQPGTHPTHHRIDDEARVAARNETGRDRGRLVRDAMATIPDATQLCLVTTSSLEWKLRRQLEERAVLRVLVVEPSGRGVRSTTKWLDQTPDMPTLVVFNNLPGGTHGTSPRRWIAQLEPTLSEHGCDVVSIRGGIAIRPLPDDQRPLIELIRHHPMLDDYRTAWTHIASHALPH